MSEEIKTDDQLIAEFMGYKLITPELRGNTASLKYSYWQKDYPEKQIVLCSDKHLCNQYKDWNELMPVVEKIEGLGFEVTIHSDACYIRKTWWRGNCPMIGSVSDKKDATYQSLVKFIKWHNQTQNP